MNLRIVDPCKECKFNLMKNEKEVYNISFVTSEV